MGLPLLSFFGLRQRILLTNSFKTGNLRPLFFRRSRTVANTASAKKRARQADNNRARNVGVRSMMRTYIKKVYYAIEAGDKAAAEAAYKEATPVIDRVAGKGLIHANKAARTKSRMNNNIRSMA
jgi:small subunit ribosomal protein S20